jgi:hypothetical protein
MGMMIQFHRSSPGEPAHLSGQNLVRASQTMLFWRGGRDKRTGRVGATPPQTGVYNAQAMRAPGILLLTLAGLPLTWNASANAAQTRLEDSLPVDWRGLPLRQVLDELTRASQTTYLVDPEVPAEVMDRRLRLFATHLTVRQAFRWAARLADLEAVVREDLVLIAPPRKLPRVWRLTGGALVEPLGWQERLAALNQRRANVTWIDSPLSSVARDISTKFAIDAIFHPSILSEEPLVHLEIVDASLAAVRTALEDQLKAKTALIDGALWVVPVAVGVEVPTTRPSVMAPASEEVQRPAGPLDQFVILDRSVQNWEEFGDRLSRAGGIACRVIPPGAPFPTPFEARGTLGEVLESARLLGRLTWRLTPAQGTQPATLEIRPRSEKR